MIRKATGKDFDEIFKIINDAADLYKAVHLPTLYVIGSDGKIIHAEYGYRENAKEEFTLIIERYKKTLKN